MLSKIRSGSLRLCYGAVSLTILIAVLSPVTASAAVRGTAPPSTQATYVNRANATSLRNSRTNYSVRFQLGQSSASTINADNSAVALTSGCHDCGAIAIAFQVIFASSQSPIALNADNTANATSYACVSCTTLAEAYQIVDIGTTQQQLTFKQLVGLEYVHLQLELLQYSGLSSGQIQSKVAELANETVALLQNSTGATPASDAPAASPVVNGSALPAQLTQGSQPGVELFVKIQSA
jgi:putative peptide zinc metalloprotease protein